MDYFPPIHKKDAQLRKAVNELIGVANCMKADLEQDLNGDEMRAVERTYLETIQEVGGMLLDVISEMNKE